ncbi:hypothetical protein [Azospirillum canadense]|uniref:hypothetical protein n=1 Tax=Azospirillum canadense TaxID=403962 RepID=UPI002226B6E2|nr:hypothetical protein [Azospirillum canadense]MCW2242018.1 hypothetical protein [Azospirillum canadense]
MRDGVKVFAALSGDVEPLLACGWLLSMVPGTAVTVGLSDLGPGAGPWARGFMDAHFLRQGHENETLWGAAATQARRLATQLPGDGALELVHEPPVEEHDLLLVSRPSPGQSLSGNPAYGNADAKKFRAVLVAPRELPTCLGRSVTVLADGPPRDLPLFGFARRLFPDMASVHLILDERTDSDRGAEWPQRLACQCPVQVSTVHRTSDARMRAVLRAGGDVLIMERSVRFWNAMTFDWRLSSFLDRTPGAVLFAS